MQMWNSVCLTFHNEQLRSRVACSRRTHKGEARHIWRDPGRHRPDRRLSSVAMDHSLESRQTHSARFYPLWIRWDSRSLGRALQHDFARVETGSKWHVHRRREDPMATDAWRGNHSYRNPQDEFATLYIMKWFHFHLSWYLTKHALEPSIAENIWTWFYRK